MTTIKILPEILSNQIAAGEVVERPVSIVKELVENSIDANATRITIEAVRGGKSLLRVSDNGIGLSRDDALLSIERYATSKLFSKEDLFSIATMGFRGEALPSIASVSKFALVTRTADSDIGTRIEIVGGKIRDVSDIGAPVGTMVDVKHLFFNTPARKKFLKSDATEISHIADAVSGLALGNSHVMFQLFLNDKLQKNFSLSDDLFQRSIRILGRDCVDKLYEFNFSDAFIKLRGYTANPSLTRSTSSKIFLFVNNRLVHDRGLVYAIFQGYKGRIMKGRFPLVVLFIDIVFEEVDVNVHPSKKEIRFFNGQRVYKTVSRIIGETLTGAQRDMAGYSMVETLPVTAHPDVVGKNFVGEPGEPSVEPQGEAREATAMEKFRYSDDTYRPEEIHRIEQPTLNWQEVVPGKKETLIIRDKEHPVNKEDEVKPEAPRDRKILGQILGTYILVENTHGLLLVDQHAAHERIVYENLKNQYTSSRTESQELLVPETLELNFKEADCLSGLLEDLKAMGLMIEPFGETTFVVKAVPSIINEKSMGPVIVDIIETVLVKKSRFSKGRWLEKILEVMACHDSIRANAGLNPVEMETLLTELEKCENPRHCPHGRPIMVTFDRKQLEKLFKRVV